MSPMVLIGEDQLCCALGQSLIDKYLGWTLLQPAVNAQGITKLRASLPRYRQVAERFPVLCIADVDTGCAAQVSAQLRTPSPPNGFVLRLAVREAESWVLADVEGFADFLEVPSSKLPLNPDNEEDPKRTVVALARRSKARRLRHEMVSMNDPNRTGVGYNFHLCEFVAKHWSPSEAAGRSPSLARAIRSLEDLIRGGQPAD